jgi:hypothetical protein
MDKPFKFDELRHVTELAIARKLELGIDAES